MTFEDKGDATLLILRERYASQAAFDEAFEGMGAVMGEQFAQLDALLSALNP